MVVVFHEKLARHGGVHLQLTEGLEQDSLVGEDQDAVRKEVKERRVFQYQVFIAHHSSILGDVVEYTVDYLEERDCIEQASIGEDPGRLWPLRNGTVCTLHHDGHPIGTVPVLVVLERAVLTEVLDGSAARASLHLTLSWWKRESDKKGE